VDGTLGRILRRVWEVGRHFGRALSQNAQGELVGHVIDATAEDPTPRHVPQQPRAAAAQRHHRHDRARLLAEGALGRRFGAGERRHGARRDPPPRAASCWRRSIADTTITGSARRARRRADHALSRSGLCKLQRTAERAISAAGIAAGHRERGVPLTAEDIAAFNLFDEIAKAPENRLAFYLERGEMMVINNYTVMHARSQFENHPEPERQRRLVRLWLDAPGFRDGAARVQPLRSRTACRRRAASARATTSAGSTRRTRSRAAAFRDDA
jgi:hypothetical protein